MYAQYSTPPPGYRPFDMPSYDYIRTPPMSPQPGPHGPHGYYSPRFAAQTATPSPRPSPKVSGHSRRASTQEPPLYSYASPRMPPYYANYQSTPRYFASQQSTPQRNSDYVSYSARPRSKSRRFRESDSSRRKYSTWGASDNKQRSSRSQYYRQYFVNDDNDHVYYDAPPPYERYESYREADYRDYYDQIPIYTEADTPLRSRARRASHSGRPNQATPKRPSTAKSPPKATEEDARRAGIPAGYSYKNWDPTEEPIMLLGSVFDANSLGKWIYDWTVFHYGPATPMSEVAGELWLLLIQLAGKVKRAEECMPKIRKQENREMVEDFLESGERLWVRFAKLLKICEEYMMKAARKETGEKKPMTMGKSSGCEFVDSIFGRDRELEKTEKLMTGMRLWSMRFDANCEDILRYPSA